MEKEIAYWIMTTLLPIGISGFGFYLSVKKSATLLEHRLTKLEVSSYDLNRQLQSQSDRLDKHEESHKTLIAMVEQIRFMSEIISEVKEDLKEIKEKL